MSLQQGDACDSPVAVFSMIVFLDPHTHRIGARRRRKTCYHTCTSLNVRVLSHQPARFMIDVQHPSDVAIVWTARASVAGWSGLLPTSTTSTGCPWSLHPPPAAGDVDRSLRLFFRVMLLSLFVSFAFFFLTTLSQAAGVLNTFIIDQTSPSVHFSDGWTVGTSAGSVGGSFESTTQIGASVTIELPMGTEDVNYFGFRSSNGALYAAYLDHGDPGGRVQIVDAFEHGGDGSQAASSLFAFTGLDSSKPHVLTVINLPDSRANNESTLTFDSLIVSVANGIDGLTFPLSSSNVPQPSDDSPVDPDSAPGHLNSPLVVGSGPAPTANTIIGIPSSSRLVTSPTATDIVVASTPSPAPSNAPSPISLSPNVVPLAAGPQPAFQPQAPAADSTQLLGPTASISAGVQPAPAAIAPSSIPSQAAGSGNGAPAPSPTVSVNVAGSPGVTVGGSSGSGASPTSDTVSPTPTSGVGSPSSNVPGGSSSNAPDGSSSNTPGSSLSNTPSSSGSGLNSGSGASSPTATASSTDSNSRSGPSGTASSSANPTSSGSTTPGSSADGASSKSKLSGPTIAVIAILSVLGVLSLILGGIVLLATRRKRLAGAQRAPSPETGEAGFVTRNRSATMRSSWSSPRRSIESTAELTNSFPVPPAHLGDLEHPSRDPVHLDSAQGYPSYGAVDVARSERYAESSSQRTFSIGSSYETGSYASSTSDEYSDPGSVHQPWLSRRVNEPI